MKAANFDYARAATIDEACRLLASAKGDGKIIAGGQTLVPLLVMRLARPALLIDINRVAELQGIEVEEGAVTVKACTRQAVALGSAEIRAKAPLLAKALGFVGHVQTRNRGTVGGSLANADPSAEIGLASLVLEAEIVAWRKGSRRTIPIAEFFRGPMTTALEEDECLTAIRFPVWRGAGRIGTGFQELSPRRSDFALAAAAAQLALDDKGVCRRLSVGVGGIAGSPFRAERVAQRLVGTRLEASDLAAALADLTDGIEIMSDIHGSADYRRRVAAALVARAIDEAKRYASAGKG